MEGIASKMRIAPNLTTINHHGIASDFSKLAVSSSIQFSPRPPNMFQTKSKKSNCTTKLFPSKSVLLCVRASYTTGVPTEEKDASSSGIVGENDLLIAGPGVLGRLVAERWRKEYPSSQIYGHTATTDHHDELVKLGINPSLKGSRVEHQFPNVIFCAPPSRSLDYPGDLREAALNWNGEGGFLFTSSSALYEGGDNGQYNEDSPTVQLGKSPKTDVLLKAEQAVLDRGGCVLRLAGLYKLDRGAHTFWLRKGVVESRPDHFLNLIHYEDAASLSVAILKKKLRGRVFLGCDNHPVTRQGLMDVVTKSGRFEQRFEGFTGFILVAIWCLSVIALEKLIPTKPTVIFDLPSMLPSRHFVGIIT